MAVWMSTWAELDSPLGAAGAKSLGQAGKVRVLEGCVPGGESRAWQAGVG